MVGKWLAVLPLVLEFNIVVLQPISNEARQLDLADCCPCNDVTRSSHSSRSHDVLTAGSGSLPCLCPRPDDTEASASILLPALRAIQPFVKQPNEVDEPKPLLKPEVGLASSVLETLRQATDEEYQEALARDAARSAVKLLESALDPLDDTILETPKNTVKIFLNKERDDMDDNLPEPSHIQETRCIHSPLTSIHKSGPLRVNRPSPIIEVFELLPKPTRKIKNKSVLHRKFQDMDNGIGASNIQERVIQPNLNKNQERAYLKTNPALLNLFTPNKLGQTKNKKELQKDFKTESESQESKPKIHIKLRELLDNLDIRKSKVPIIDLKKYFSPDNFISSFQLSTTEKTNYNNKSLLPKDLLKLKDIELIPTNTLTKNIKRPPAKFQSAKSRTNPDNCNEDNSNVIPFMNQDNGISKIPTYSDIADPETSPSMANSFSTVQSVPIDYEDEPNFDYSEMKAEEDSKKKQTLSEHCNVGTKTPFRGLSNNNVPEENNVDTNGDRSNNQTYQIEFLEDFDTPIEFDNSSFISESHISNNDNKRTLQDQIGDTSVNVFEINDLNNKNSNIPQENGNEMLLDCYSSEKSNFASEQQSSMEEVSIQQVSSENENPSQISFRDLQDMSDSILSLSECEPHREEQIKSNLNEASEEMDYDILNVPLPLSETVPNDKETDNAPDRSSIFNENAEVIEEIDGKLCKAATFDESLSVKNQDHNKIIVNSDTQKNEMRAETSEPQSKSYNPLFRNNVENGRQSDFFTKPSAGSNDILKVNNKHSVFSNNLKSKVERLFTTTEKVNDIVSNSDDNINESSNINNIVAKSNKLQRTSQPFLRKTLPPEFPGISLNSLTDKLALPNFMKPKLSGDSLNFLNLPSPFDDTSDPSIAFTALTDKLRSHTENTIQNVKETLESTLKNSPNFRISGHSEPFDTHDILESISNRHKDMKEKLEAIHLDLNDRFSSFQQSVLDHFNVLGEHSRFQEGDNILGLRSSHNPVIQSLALPELTKLRNENLERFLLPNLNNGKRTEINIMSPKLSKTSDETSLLNSDRILQNPMSYSTTTPIPSFIPRQKVLKTNMGPTPKLPNKTLLKSRPSKTTDSQENVTKMKPFSRTLERSRNLFEEPHSSPNLASTKNLPVKSFKANTKQINKDNLSMESPRNNFRKTLMKNNRQKLGASNIDNNDRQETLLSRIKDGRARTGSRRNDGMLVSPTSHRDTARPSQNESGLRMVEPLRENVPYKCKLICYKD